MTGVLRFLFFLIVVRPIVLVIIGLNVRRRKLLPGNGPALVVANHNSHLDALTLMTLFGMKRLHKVHPIAAADYFLKNRLLAWFSTKIIGIIPLDRKSLTAHSNPLVRISEALQAGSILILFPEGSRGEPEKIDAFRTGVAHIAKRHPNVPVTPVFMHGLGKTLPRGEAVLVPFFCDIFIGESMTWSGSRDEFMNELTTRMLSLADECPHPEWT